MSRRRLLIISCSQKKRLLTKALPAIDRYDGPLFQVLRKFQITSAIKARNLDVYILSAKFGLIPSYKKIPFYDQRMNYECAMGLHYKVNHKLSIAFNNTRYKEIFVCVGKDYLQALNGYELLLPKNSALTVAAGSSGRRQAMLHKWLYGEVIPKPKAARTGIATIRNIKITLTPKEVIDIASRALAKNEGEPFRYQNWYVSINGKRIAPKWLVSLLTGLPVGEFHSDEARRVLQQLGINIYSV